ncbi:spartin a isoform X2 [Anarrhichthys ocellatus]|uniref:spartin a isoform X2 n=1 Tax=Anarrhichthys ocellatus TaxID=433405 RepID=UPI0012ECBB1E|nr:spartin isoform X2 [Anarrhichthys ocellatus]
MTEPAELLLIKGQYELAFHSLSQGLSAEEAGKRAEALVFYRKGRQHLTQGVEVPTGGERQRGAVWDTARHLQQRMGDTLRTVNTHLSDLETSQLTEGCQRVRLLMDLPPNLYPDLAQSSQPPQSSLSHLYPTIPATTHNTTLNPPPRSPSPDVLHALPAATPGTLAMANSGDQPPAYTPQPTVGHRSLSYGPARGGLRPGKQAGATAGGDGNELLFIPSGVQMFFVAPNGQVSSLSHPGYLRIITFDSQHKGSTAGRPSTFLHVCDWLYPLTADTPVLLANSGIFMFPDTLSETPGSYVGIVLSSELPAVHQETFRDLLSQLVDLRVQDPEGEGSEVINLSEKIPLGPMKEHEGLTVPTGTKDKAPLPGWSEKMGQGILIVNGVSTVAGHMADKIAPHVKKQSSKLVPKSMKNKDGRPSNWGGAKFVAVSSIHSFSTVWSSLETGAKLVGKSVTAETVTTMTYKYGDEAGEATDNGLKSLINVGVAAYNFDNLGIKAILKTAGKQTAKAMARPREQPAQTQGKEVQKRELQAETHGKEKQMKMETE